MRRFKFVVIYLLSSALLGLVADAENAPKKLTPEERRELETKREELSALGVKAYAAGNIDQAANALTEALRISRQLYPKDEYPDGHANLAKSLYNLAYLYDVAHARYADAEGLYRDALDMRKRLFKGDHADVARSLTGLAALYFAQGKYADAESLSRDALEMHKRLFEGDHPSVAQSMSNLAALYVVQRKYTQAESLSRDALEMRKRLFKGDNPGVALSLNNLAGLYEAQRKYPEAETLSYDALEMYKRLFRGDHPNVALTLNNLAALCEAQGKYAKAEALANEAFEMRKRMFKDDHPDVAHSLNNLASQYFAQRKYSDAEPLYRDALKMRKRLYKGDHPDVALSMNNLAVLCEAQQNYTDAELLSRDALDMYKRLFKGDHPDVALSMNNLASVCKAQGNYADAETFFYRALNMKKRLFNGDHPDLPFSMNNLATLLQAQAKLVDAGPLYRDALSMANRLSVAFAGQKDEGEALTLNASLPLYRDGFLSNAIALKSDPATIYLETWTSKGTIARIYEGRRLAARATTTVPKTAKLLTDLIDVRRRRAELILAPDIKDPKTRQQRENDLNGFDKRIADLERDLRQLLPTIGRAENLAKALPRDFQMLLPADAALVDFVRYTFFEYDKDKLGKAGEKRTERYLAFVVTKDKVAWLDLDTAEKIESALSAWRAAITGGKELPAEVPKKVRELVWDKVQKELPAGVKTLYISPDGALCTVPWGALPGDKPGTVLLEDYAISTIPYATFLLDKLWPQEPRKNPPTGALVVGGVKYDAELSSTTPKAVASIRGPLVQPDEKPGWQFLPGTVAEIGGVTNAAAAKKTAVTAITEEKATTPAVLAALPKAKYAHFATHGFFADPSFRSVFQLDEKDYEMSRRGERIGRAANSPLVMTGLVLAGANNPKTPGRGIMTGEALIDLDLSGLELAVLSACETGLRPVGGGEGTFGLQRAFHMAGARDVVASLWKVPDQSTAALMSLFYHNLWDKNLSPMESLRQAQLDIYKNPTKISELAKGFRGKFELVPGTGSDVEIKTGPDGKAHPRLWAAFVLSGPGR
jgi:CHAT domain-containing protein/tetratricopeptide (TPR) repeat protein